MTRPPDPRGANRRGSGWGDDIGYSADAPTFTPQPRYVAPKSDGQAAPQLWHTVRLDTGEYVQVLPLQGRMPKIIDWGGRMRRVVEIIDVSPEFALATVEELGY